MQKKKILFAINNLETGGVQTSLLNLLKEIHNKYEVTLALFRWEERYRDLLPENVKVIVTKSPFKHFGISKKDTKGKPFLFLMHAFWVLLARFFGRSFTTGLMSLFQRKLKGYDYAISFLHEGPQKLLYGGCNEFVLRKVDAAHKSGWLHCDFGRCGANNRQSQKIYSQFDNVIACSEGSRLSFVSCMPELAEKAVAVRNCNDFSAIRLLAGDGVSYDKTHFHMVTVARLSEVKGIERALEAISLCKEKGFSIRYHLVGSGATEQMLREKARALGLVDDVVFYGNQTNPYPYIKNADLFLLPSYHEAAPMVFDEAACLGVPVLATQTTSTQEMLTESGNGIVCENSQEGINSALLALLQNPESLHTIRQSLATKIFDNSKALSAFESVIK